MQMQNEVLKPFAEAKPLHAPSSLSCQTLCSLEGIVLLYLNHSGEYNGEATPVPIPNTAVKLSCANDTWLVTARENRSSPDYIPQ
jgi:hypothetical protein